MMRLSLALTLVLVSACNFREDKVSPLSNPDDRKNWFAFLDRTVLQPSCVRCHAGSSASAGIDLTSYANVMASRTVVPGSPDKSTFYTSVASGRMPKGEKPLNADALQFIKEWIEKGAKEKADDPVITPPPADPEPTATWDYIAKYIVEARCVSCHKPPKPKAGVDLSTLDIMLTDGIIVPGDAEGSPFYQQISEGLMPPNPPDLTVKQLKAVKDWILDGAKPIGGTKDGEKKTPSDKKPGKQDDDDKKPGKKDDDDKKPGKQDDDDKPGKKDDDDKNPVPPGPRPPEPNPNPNPAPNPAPNPNPPAAGGPAPTWAYVGQVLIQSSCVRCHAPPKPKGDVDLSSYGVILKEGYVVPGDPDASPLYQQIEQGLMPPRKPLGDDVKAAVRDWIKQGAKQSP